MGEKRFLTVQADYRKVQVPVDDILYITIEGRKTKITRTDGSALCTNRSLKDIYAELPEEIFSSINRGIVVSKTYIKQEKSGVITMKDGAQFKRRVRSDRLKERPKVIPAGSQEESWTPCPVEALNDWVGKLPLPLCVLELVYRSRRGGADFVVRYCNRAMEELEHVRLETVQDQPLTVLKGLGNPKWLTVFADVAINGGTRSMEELWEENGKFLRLYCYQPRTGCCALVLADLTRENSLIQELFQRGR